MSEPDSTRGEQEFRPRQTGRLFAVVKAISLIELGIFAALLVVWLAPGLERATFWFGLAHGIGFLILCAAIWVAVLRREAPFWLLASALTPVGPVGSTIGIYAIERREARSTNTAAPRPESRQEGEAGPREAGGPRGPRPHQRVGSQGGMPTRSPPEAGLTGDEP